MVKYKRVIMVLVFLIGLGMFIYPIISKNYYESHLNDVVNNFNQNIEITSPDYLHKTAIEDYVFATIEIDKLDLKLPIYYGASNEILANGIGLIENIHQSIGGINTHSILAGHTGIASKELFTNINKLELGDQFKVHTHDEELEYEVIDNRKIKVTETEYLQVQEDRDLVTLLTCPTFDSKNYRIIITGERIGTDKKQFTYPIDPPLSD